jgi:hypothetical protein
MRRLPHLLAALEPHLDRVIVVSPDDTGIVEKSPIHAQQR